MWEQTGEWLTVSVTLTRGLHNVTWLRQHVTLHISPGNVLKSEEATKIICPMSSLDLEIDVWIQKLLWHQIKCEKLPRGWVRYICRQFSLISKMKGLGQQWKITVVKHFNVINYFNIKINILVKCTWLLMTDRETKTTLPSHCSLNRPHLALGKRC